MRLWLRRYEQQGFSGLQDRSRALKRITPSMQYTARDVRSEFVGSYDSKDKSRFSSVVEEKYQARHVRIPRGTYTYNSDVESFHRTIEDEFYDIEEFRDRTEFMNKLTTYLIFYNMIRKNSNKDWKSPREILKEIAPDSRLDIKLRMPIFLDEKLRERCYKEKLFSTSVQIHNMRDTTSQLQHTNMGQHLHRHP